MKILCNFLKLIKIMGMHKSKSNNTHTLRHLDSIIYSFYLWQSVWPLFRVNGTFLCNTNNSLQNNGFQLQFEDKWLLIITVNIHKIHILSLLIYLCYLENCLLYCYREMRNKISWNSWQHTSVLSLQIND